MASVDLDELIATLCACEARASETALVLRFEGRCEVAALLDGAALAYRSLREHLVARVGQRTDARENV